MKANPSDIERIVFGLCKAYSRAADPDLVDVYTEALLNHDLDLIRDSIHELTTKSEWMPKPSEIIAVVNRMKAEAAKATAEPAHHKLDTYKCPLCRDEGLVDVWSIESMRRAIRHLKGEIDIQEDRSKLYEDVAKCTCARGQKKPGRAGTFRSPPMVRVKIIATMEERIDDLIRWAEKYTGITKGDFDVVHRS